MGGLYLQWQIFKTKNGRETFAFVSKREINPVWCLSPDKVDFVISEHFSKPAPIQSQILQRTHCLLLAEAGFDARQLSVVMR